MLRAIACSVIMVSFFCFLPGCGGGGSEPVFEESLTQTAEEVSEAEDYEAMLKKQDQDDFSN